MGALRIVPGTASVALAEAMAARLQTSCVPTQVDRYPDGELRPAVGHVRGDDVYVVLSTAPPVSGNVIELLLLIDACRRAGADRVTAVVPYFGYARQDRRVRAGDALASRVIADAIATAGADRLLVVDPHTAALEAIAGIPVEMVTSMPMLCDAMGPAVSADTVVISPDLGGAKLAEHVASLLQLPVGVVRKTRLTGATVRAEELIGEVAGRRAVIVDDMISTGATIEAALKVLAAKGAESDVLVAAAHGLFVGDAIDRMRFLGAGQVVVTDTVPQAQGPLPGSTILSVAPLLADAVDRLHRGVTLDDLRVRA